MIKRYGHDEIVKRLDNLKKVLGEFNVSIAINTFKLCTDNEDDYLHLAFYFLKNSNLKYRQTTFGIKQQLNYEKKKWYYSNYSNVYGVSLRQDDSDAYTITTAANTANYAVQYMPIYNTYTTAINEL
jgi:hypothetical protein